MKYSLMKYKDVEDYKGFILPEVLDLPGHDKYQYICAWDDDGIEAMAVIRKLDEDFALLSLAVEESKTGQGIGSAFVDYIVSVLKENEAKNLSVDLFAERDVDGRISNFLAKNGFITEGKKTIAYETTVEEVSKSTWIDSKDNESLVSRVKPLREVSDSTLHRFAAKNCDVDENQIRKEMHPDCSMCFMEGDNIVGAFWLAEMEDNNLVNTFSLVDEADPRAFLVMIKASYNAMKGMPGETKISLYCLDNISDGLLRKLIPGVNEIMSSVEYKREINESRMTDVVFEKADLSNICCAKCKYATGDTLSCEMYKKKPGYVLYGETCDDLELK